jgi:hypothetical protein
LRYIFSCIDVQVPHKIGAFSDFPSSHGPHDAHAFYPRSSTSLGLLSNTSNQTKGSQVTTRLDSPNLWELTSVNYEMGVHQIGLFHFTTRKRKTARWQKSGHPNLSSVANTTKQREMHLSNIASSAIISTFSVLTLNCVF